MSRIRAAEPYDLEPVAALYERVVRSGASEPSPELVDYFRRTVVDHPWADPEIPSLVYESSDGRILGFIGSHVRRGRFDGRPIRIGCSGQLISDPSDGSPAIGPMLMRSYLGGAQDLTITDGATPLVSDLWARLGGFTLHPHSIVWTRLLRPSRAVGDRLLVRAGRPGWRRSLGPLLGVLDGISSRLTRPPAGDADLERDALTPAAMVEHGPALIGDARLHVERDEAFAAWLLHELAMVTTRGRLVPRLLRRAGRLVGWYVAYLLPGGTSVVLEVRAVRGELEAVLDEVVAEAWRSGSTAVEGRVDPWLFEAVARRDSLMRPGERVLFHTRDTEIRAAMALGGSGLTRLDGEWWMGHHTEPFS